MKRKLLALFLSAVMIVSMMAIFPASAAEPELDWDLLDLQFNDASDATKIPASTGAGKFTVADGILKTPTKNTTQQVLFSESTNTGKMVIEFKFRSPNGNVFFHILSGTTRVVQIGINGGGNLYMKGSTVDVDGDANTGDNGKEASGVFLKGANDEEWHTVTVTLDFTAKTIMASADGGTANGGSFATWAIDANAAKALAETGVSGIDLFLHNSASNPNGTTGAYLEVDYVRASTGATVSSGETPETAPVGKYKGTYVTNPFDAATGITLGSGGTVANGVLTVPGQAATVTVDFDDITVQNNTICVSLAVKATSDMAYIGHLRLNTDVGYILFQINGGSLASWGTGAGAAQLGSIKDNEWHTIDIKYTFGTDWEVAMSLDGGEANVLNPTVTSAWNGDLKGQLEKLETSTIIKSFQINTNNTATGKGALVIDNFAIGDGTLLSDGETPDPDPDPTPDPDPEPTPDPEPEVPNANDYFGKFAGTYVDLGFDASDLTGITAPAGSVMVNENGTLLLSTTTKNDTTNAVPYPVHLSFDSTKVDITKPFTISFRVKMNNAVASFIQMWSDIASNQQLGQVNTSGQVCIPISTTGAVNTGSKSPVKDIKADGNWHAFDYLITPKDEGGYTIVVYMDGEEILRTGDNAAFDAKFAEVKFNGGISFFELRLYAAGKYSGTQELSVEMDYFRIGDGTLVGAEDDDNSGEGGDNSEENGDTADMTVSVAVGSVAALVALYAASKKRHSAK